MNLEIQRLTHRMDRRSPVSLKQLDEIFMSLGFQPPEDYVQFMGQTDGSEGSIGKAYLAIYSLEELVSCNAQTRKLEPGILFFATDRGGEGYAFEIDKQPSSIVALEFADLDRSRAKQMGHSLLEFLQRLSIEVPEHPT